MNGSISGIDDENVAIDFKRSVSYKVSPLDALKMIIASSVFGEPSFLGDRRLPGKNFSNSAYSVHRLFDKQSIIDKRFIGLFPTEIIEKAIDKSLIFDYEGTLRFAAAIRRDGVLNQTPQVIMVRASVNPKRKDFTAKHPGEFSKINGQVMSTAGGPAVQLAYWLHKNSTKNNIPTILKKSWASKLSSCHFAELDKYRDCGAGIIDTARVCHASSADLDRLLRGEAGSRSKKSPDSPCPDSGGHLLLLENLTSSLYAAVSQPECLSLMDRFKEGVSEGKQHPLKYLSLAKNLAASCANHKQIALDALEECIDMAAAGLPWLHGKTMCLVDNSGWAWNTASTESMPLTFAEMGNLLGVVAAKNADEGYVAKFGDKLHVKPILDNKGVFCQYAAVSERRVRDVGGVSENGIWQFFDNAVKNTEVWDNIFIYSGRQPCHGDLVDAEGRYIDVAGLILDYRRKVNNKVNVFSINLTGRPGSALPEYGYRTNIITGWSGNELQFAKAMAGFWDGLDLKNDGSAI